MRVIWAVRKGSDLYHKSNIGNRYGIKPLSWNSRWKNRLQMVSLHAHADSEIWQLVCRIQQCWVPSRDTSSIGVGCIIMARPSLLDLERFNMLSLGQVKSNFWNQARFNLWSASSIHENFASVSQSGVSHCHIAQVFIRIHSEETGLNTKKSA